MPESSFSRRRFLGASAVALAGGESLMRNARAEEAGSSVKTRLPRLDVHREGHYLQTEDGEPFFWLGDTAWRLIHATTRDECGYYLQTRAMQGFNVVQAVVLSEMEGIRKPSALGLYPFVDGDPRRPIAAYFSRVMEIVDEAALHGLYVALLPTWGDKLTAPWGDGPRIFRNDNLEVIRDYGRYLAGLLRDRSNIIWMLGGDRPARVQAAESPQLHELAAQFGVPGDCDWTPIWTALAESILEVTPHPALLLYHPQGGPQSTSILLRDAKWLSVNAIQSGHGGGHDAPTWEFIGCDYAIVPPKPTIDLEPNYEDHPYNPWPQWDPATGYYRDHDVRKQLYRSVFAGACGVTYGHHAVWQFANRRNGVINYADRDWTDAMQRPAGRQAVFLKRLIASRPFFERIPDQKVISQQSANGADHAQATRHRDGSYLFVYLPHSDQRVQLNLSSMLPGKKNAWWFDPRTGTGTRIESFPEETSIAITTPPYGPDWVLVVDHAERQYGLPGIPHSRQ